MDDTVEITENMSNFSVCELTNDISLSVYVSAQNVNYKTVPEEKCALRNVMFYFPQTVRIYHFERKEERRGKGKGGWKISRRFMCSLLTGSHQQETRVGREKSMYSARPAGVTNSRHPD